MDDVIIYFSGGEVVRGYDFLVNSVWPEVVTSIENKAHSIFAPGNPAVFHQVSWNNVQYRDEYITKICVCISSTCEVMSIGLSLCCWNV